MSFHIYDDKLLEKHQNIWTKIGGLKSTNLNTLPVYNDIYIYIKATIRTHGHNVYTSFRALNLPEDDMECESFL